MLYDKENACKFHKSPLVWTRKLLVCGPKLLVCGLKLRVCGLKPMVCGCKLNKLLQMLPAEYLLCTRLIIKLGGDV